MTTFVSMTYNLWGGHHLDARVPALRSLFEVRPPDLLSVQELTPRLRELIDAALPGHRRVDDPFPGWGTQSNLWWRDDLFTLEEHGAEDVGIRAEHARLFWARLRARPSGGGDAASGRSDAAPGPSDAAPGRSDAAPGRSNAAPGLSGVAFGASDTPPGREGPHPTGGHRQTRSLGDTDAASGRSDAAPGPSDAAPGRSNAAPGLSDVALGASDTPPGREGPHPTGGHRQTRSFVYATAHLTWPGHPQERADDVSPRVGQARNIVAALDRLAGDGPCLFTADVNDYARPLWVLREAGFADAFAALGRSSPITHPVVPLPGEGQGQRPGWAAPEPVAKAIDWQFHRGPLRPRCAEVVEFFHEGVAPSDHKPVVVTYTLPDKEKP
ncbi:endonuclease/exonuclease/phosphatase family protein [Jiangella alba]|uniref:Endonuclease/Exonuclease/phosphatase family protein n=1 Tax=Jiangella alba TaxID=561176 RepID=A0A1H5PT16_9ACTN|nr:endonuclease/exonuclease/phosphatase family protein [Jiangella alba]SEF16784.1 Endonuclease/Exonuclease/phosphatase family protein [Jiangella alba]